MKTLLKEYNLDTTEDYFNMVLESYLNGQITQAQEQFNRMPHHVKKSMVSQLIWEDARSRQAQFFFGIL